MAASGPDENGGDAIPQPNDQAVQINDLMEAHDDNIIGESWYCVNMKWWNVWKNYVEFDKVAGAFGKETKAESSDDKPGKILNEHLVVDRSALRLKKQITMAVDFELVHETVWKKISSWYGFDMAISRDVVGRNTDKIVELYPRIFAAVSSEVGPLAVLF